MSDAWSISADWIIPAGDPPLRRGVLRMRDGVIEAVGTAETVAPAARHEPLGAVAVLPGLVNAHCHLELTGLRGRLPRERPMPQWLFAMLNERRKGIDFAGGARRGAAELLAGGCTTVGDISHDNGAWRVLKPLPIRKVCFAEVIGIGPLAAGAMGRLQESLEGIEPDERLSFGISPHAPYSTAENVYRRAVDLARKRGMRVTTHLAESPAERRFLQKGDGPLFRFLARLGLINLSVTAPGESPVTYAGRLGLLAAGTILAHVHDADDADLDLLAGGEADVAYCPGSAAFFARPGHRYDEMLGAGINVCLGTDSLASNDALNMLGELRTVHAEGKVTAETTLRMGTVNGARALGMADTVGALAPGLAADWIAVPCPAESADPVDAVLAGNQPVTRTVIAGEDVLPAVRAQ